MYGNVVKRVIWGTDIQNSIPEKKENPLVSMRGMGINGKMRFELTADMLTRGVALIGETGSGKTYCLKKLVKEIRNNIRDDYSMIVVQAKNDFLDILREGDYVIEQGKNAQNSVHWNLFKDILKDGYEETMIELNTREFVSHLFADKKNQKEQFFVEGAKELLYCIIIAFIKKGTTSLLARENLTNKGLRDFFLEYDESEYADLLKESGEPGVLRMILGDGTDNLQALGVYGELVTTVLNSLVDIFAMQGDFSIREFVYQKKGKCLFINYDPAYKDSQLKIYSSIIKLVLKEALSQNASEGNVILVCDELPTMGKTDIAEAVNLGRAKGLMTILGMQSIAQLYSIYDENDGKKLLSGMCTKLYFRPNDLLTREYMMGDFGKVIAEYMVLSPGGTYAERRESTVLEEDEVIRMNVGDCYIRNAKGEMFYFNFE